MYTVIIQSPETARLSRDYRRLFFEEHIARGELDFCTWIKSGDSVDTAVPALYDLVAGKREWRAIIVQTEKDRLNGPASRPRNPFDFIENKENDPYEAKESTIPLIRLTQLLGGVPEPEIRYEQGEKVDEYGRTQVVYVPDKVQHQAAMKEHARIAEQYQFVENRPREILVISTRQSVDNSESEIDAAWRKKLETESSEFWSRNRYPSACRFMTCDVLNERHSLYPGSIFKLWSAVLLLSINQIEASSLQAYRIYNLSLELDQERLSAAFSRYAAKMGGMTSQLDAADANRETVESQVARKAPQLDEEVNVAFSTKQSADLRVDTHPLGLVTDQPQDEREFWGERYRRSTAALNELLRAPGRALDVAADDTRRRGVYPPGEVEILNRYQRSDLSEHLEASYFGTLAARAALGLNVKRRQRERAIIDQQVRRRIAQRLSGKRAGIAAGVCLAVLVVGSLPYIIGAGRVSGSALLWSLLTVVVMLLIAGGFGLAELWIQRKEMADTMEDHNRCMHEVLREMQIGAQHYSDYLSCLCTYLRGRSYLDREQELLNGLANVEKLRHGHRRAILKCVGLVRVWSAALGATVDVTLVEKDATVFDAAIPPEENAAYRFELPPGGRNIPLNNTGERMFAPYDFIRGINLEREELFDDVDSDWDL